mgnify:CR=1 FL=1
MPIRMAVTKQTANGEQFVADVCQWNPVTGEIVHEDISELTRLVDETLKLADYRLMEMNVRSLESRQLQRYFEPAVWMKVRTILDIIAGRVDVDTVAARWESEVEETQELEAGRLSAALAALEGQSNGVQ